MNHIYRIVWNAATGVWQAVAEVGTGRGKGKGLRRARRNRRALFAVALASLSVQPSFASTNILPTNGSVIAGSGTVTQNGSNMTINQATNKLAIDWQSFSIGSGNTVQFIQPSSSSVALNRVTGNEVANPGRAQG